MAKISKIMVLSDGLSLFYPATSISAVEGLNAELDDIRANATTGKSAYESAVDNGFEGTESEWVESLKGDSLSFSDLTSEQKTELKGEKGDAGIIANFKPSAELCTSINDAYIDSNGDLLILTSTDPEEFLNVGTIRGPKGDKGDKGDIGPKGEHGMDAYVFYTDRDRKRTYKLSFSDIVKKLGSWDELPEPNEQLLGKVYEVEWDTNLAICELDRNGNYYWNTDYYALTTELVTDCYTRYAITDTNIHPSDTLYKITKIDNVQNGVYIWGKTTVNYSNGTTALIESVSYVGKDGLGNATVPMTDSQKRLFNFEENFLSVKYGRANKSHGRGKGWYKRFCLLHLSDVHKDFSGMTEVIEMALDKADAICCTGDTSNIGTKNFNNDVNTIKSVVKTANVRSIPYLDTPGNHDCKCSDKNVYIDRISTDLVDYFNSYYNENGVFETDVIRAEISGVKQAYGYVDIPISQHMADFNDNSPKDTIRIIMLDMTDYSWGDGSLLISRKDSPCTISQELINWLIGVLIDSANNGVPVITMGHYSFSDRHFYSNNEVWDDEHNAILDAHSTHSMFIIPDIIDAMLKRLGLTKTYSPISSPDPNNDFSGMEDIVINSSNYDHTQLTKNLKYICHLYGHIHAKSTYRCKDVANDKTYNILMLGEAALSSKGTALNKVYHSSYDSRSSILDVSCSMLCVDTIEECIYRVNYGAYLPYDGSQVSRIEKIPYIFND